MSTTEPLEYYFKRYGDLELQRRMVGDRWRTDAFARGIAEAVRPGDVVLDVGTGTGILAMLAAKAGAKRVYAIDQSEIAQTAANLVKANGLSDVIKVLRGPAAELELDEPVDLLMSEWLGHMAFVEAMLDDVIVARDRHLAKGGRMLPSHVRTFLAPVDDPVLFEHDGPGFWRTPVHGLDFSALEPLELAQGRSVQIRVEPAALLAKGREMASLDLVTARVDDPWTSGEVEFEARRDGVLNGFVGWFDIDLSKSHRLDTGPMHPETHWSQTYFPFEPRPVKRGQKISVGYRLERDPDERRNCRITLQVGRHSQTYGIE
ncbi:50S ribosomal protein L11 methyltransferase [Myxococcota bacterium]|nr:50S ribosomal protein L11 methyltransferase [Myxococcota bacterium]